MIRANLTWLTALLLVTACSAERTPLVVPFVAMYGDSVLRCAASEQTALSDLRLYVQQPRVISATGDAVPVRLTASAWQAEELALLDFENASGACVNGTTATNVELVGSVPAGNYRGLEFTLGVPFDLNHADPLLAAAPLGDADMHWHWRGGYKFLRAGVSKADDNFWLHLGSTGCEGTIQNITGCNAPNRVRVRLDDFQPGDSVVIDVAALLAPGQLLDGEMDSCSSGPAESSCATSFAALGLAHGNAPGGGEQRVFRVQSP